MKKITLAALIALTPLSVNAVSSLDESKLTIKHHTVTKFPSFSDVSIHIRNRYEGARPRFTMKNKLRIDAKFLWKGELKRESHRFTIVGKQKVVIY